MPMVKVGRMNSSRTAMLFVRAPWINPIITTDVQEWIKFFEEKSRKRRRRNAQQYDNCRRLLRYAKDVGGQNTKVTGVYSMPCRGGNQLAFVFDFGNAEAKDEFMDGLRNL